MAQPIHETTDEARAGTTPHIVRYVLGISLALAIIIMALVVIWGDSSSDDRADGQITAPAAEDAAER